MSTVAPASLRGLANERPPSHLSRFAMAAEQGAPAGAAGIVTAHTAGQIISVVTVQAADQPDPAPRRRS